MLIRLLYNVVFKINFIVGNTLLFLYCQINLAKKVSMKKLLTLKIEKKGNSCRCTLLTTNPLPTVFRQSLSKQWKMRLNN
jgi:hypothetical protein